MTEKTLPARVTPATATKIKQIIDACPAERYTRIQVITLAVDLLAKKFLPKSTNFSTEARP